MPHAQIQNYLDVYNGNYIIDFPNLSVASYAMDSKKLSKLEIFKSKSFHINRDCKQQLISSIHTRYKIILSCHYNHKLSLF